MNGAILVIILAIVAGFVGYWIFSSSRSGGFDIEGHSRGYYIRTAIFFAFLVFLYGPIIVIGIVKVGEPMRHRAQIEDIILTEEYDGQADAVRAITQRITKGIERLARAHPEQYFWLHRRWKHQPSEKKSKKEAA